MSGFGLLFVLKWWDVLRNLVVICEAFLEEGSFKAAGRREDAEFQRHGGLCTNLFHVHLIHSI
jgi:hypothetical protein